jgi:hypothetical protein
MRGSTRVAAVLLLIAVALSGASVALAGASAARYSVQIQAVFNLRGNPWLVANFSPNGSLATAHWSICSPPPMRKCVPRRTPHQALEPDPRPAGTVFRATARYLGQTYSAQKRWHGRITADSRPRLLGPARVGMRVNPVGANWTGGWGNEFDQLGVEACRTRKGRSCVTVSGGALGCPDDTHAVIHRAIKGWYLFALDARSPAEEVCAGVAYGSESGIPVWSVGRTVARSAPLGPVTA